MPDGSEPRPPNSEPVGPETSPIGRRVNEYVDIWEKAASRLLAADYHAEDLVDDWFTWWGKWARDSAAAVTVAWRNYAKETVDRSAEGPPSDAG
jgi:hypothetical protein